MEDSHKMEKKEKHVKKIKLKPVDIWKIISAIAVILLIASISTNGFKLGGGLSKNAAAEKAINFINTNLMQPGMSATLEDVTTEGNLYKLTLSISGQTFDSYISKDGSLLFPQAISLDAPLPNVDTQTPATGAATFSCENVDQTEKPLVELFVMAQCPFGVIAENAMYPVYKLLKDNIDFNLHFIATKTADGFSSLHGQPEVDEDLRQVCIMDKYPDKYFSYIECVNENYQNPESVWEGCAEEFNIDVDEITTCYQGEEGASLLEENIKKTNEYGVTGSPTMFINGEKYSGQRTPQLFQDAICCGFSEQPEGCSTEITEIISSVDGSC